MFSSIENVVSSRDLFNSNPCQDFWDSQQFSQAASGSQGSQGSSLELLSQSKSLQNQRLDSGVNDGWHNTTISQKGNEDEPVKYYMKYLSKPLLFSEQSKNGGQGKGHTESYKDYIETQKTKAIERDQRELLDNFIGLLKDYTKEVQKAMETFKESLDVSTTENTKNADNIKSAAEKSFTLVDELKEDFRSSFNKLRIDLKENEELKTLLSKKEQKIMELDIELHLHKKEIEVLKDKEQDALKREEDFKQKEKCLLEKVKEMEMRAADLRDTPPLSQEAIIRNRQVAFHPANIHQINQVAYHPMEQLPSKFTDVYTEQHCVPVTSRTDYSRRNGITQRFPLEYNSHLQAYSREALADGKVLIPPAREYSSRLRNLEMHPAQSNNCPTASITPVQQSKSITQFNGHNPTSPNTLLHSSDVPSLTNNAASSTSQTANTLPSPANIVSLLDKNKLPKKSPVATVLPQVQGKPRNGGVESKDYPHDPARIFNFDLTTSPQGIQPSSNHNNEESLDKKERPHNQVKKMTKPKKGRPKTFTKEPVRNYSTRSRTKSGVTSEDNTHGDDTNSDQCSTAPVSPHKPKTTAPMGLKRKVFSSGVSQSKKRRTDDIVCASKETCDVSTNCLANISKSFEGCVKSFKRQNSEKRTLDLSGSSLFEIIDEEVSIQQIAESIRKHAQKRKVK